MKRSIFSLLLVLGMLATVIGYDSGGSSEGNSGTKYSASVDYEVSASLSSIAETSYEAYSLMSTSGSTGGHSVGSRGESYVESYKSNLTSACTGLTNKLRQDVPIQSAFG